VASLTAVQVTAPAHAASFALNADGSFSYTPVAGYIGIDTFTYVAKDVSPVSSRNIPATVTIIVGPTPPFVISITPLKTPTNLGGSVTVDWELTDGAGVRISSLSTLLKVESVFNGAMPPGGCVASATGTKVTLWTPATGGNAFKLQGQGYRYTWDTNSAVPTGVGCYTVLLTLSDGTAPRMTSAVQLR
jgi:hypothetical protein